MSQVVSGSVTELREKMDDGTLVRDLVRATGSRQAVNAETGEVGAWRNSLPILLDVVQRNNLRLRDLVERLLDLAGLESGQAVLTVQPVDLASLIGDAIDAISPTAAAG